MPNAPDGLRDAQASALAAVDFDLFLTTANLTTLVLFNLSWVTTGVSTTGLTRGSAAFPISTTAVADGVVANALLSGSGQEDVEQLSVGTGTQSLSIDVTTLEVGDVVTLNYLAIQVPEEWP